MNRRCLMGGAVALLLGVATACTASGDAPTRLRVLASAELADMRPLLDELRDDTGVELVMDYRGTVEATNALAPGRYQHDLAWLSSDRYFQLKLKGSGYGGPRPLFTNIMLYPLVVGVKPKAAELLRRSAPDRQISWADLADHAATGSLRFGMADPRRDGGGLAALVGVATAAAGTGGVLRPGDVTCDRLRGFFTGHTLVADDSQRLRDEFVKRQADVDALINYESALLSLNASGELTEKLEIIYPRDGIVQSEYPLLLLDPAKRAAYDKVVEWLTSAPVQKKIMERTLRRPLDPTVSRDPRLPASVGNALYFPDQQEIVDKLLADYADPALRGPREVIFVLDFSGSMRGARMAALRETFAVLSGGDRSADGKFFRFYRGERFTVMRFGGRILEEQRFTVNGQQDLDDLRRFIAIDDFDGHTAIWSALDRAYKMATGDTSIVLMTDGENNAGISLDDLLRRRAVPTFTIRYGEANAAELDRVARATGGRLVDANATSLLDAFKEIRGCR
jgi:Ca-activated chloride channel homolog